MNEKEIGHRELRPGLTEVNFASELKPYCS